MDPNADTEGDVGPLDDTAVAQIREEFTRVDSLVSEAGFDSLLSPTKLVVWLDDGIGDAGWCRFDIPRLRLTVTRTMNSSRFSLTESGRD